MLTQDHGWYAPASCRDVAIGIGGIASLYALHLFVILVHEFGHGIAAYLLGLRSNEIAVGPFVWKRDKGTSLARQFTHMLGGHVQAQFASLPPAAWKAFLFVAAGPILSAGLALAMAPLADYSRVGSVIPIIVMLDSAFVAFVCLIPTRLPGGRTSDGHKLWALLFSRNKRERLLYMLSVRAQGEVLKQHWHRREFQAVLRIVDQMLGYSREDPSLMANAKWQTALGKLRVAALKGVEDPESVELECDDAQKLQPAPAGD